MLLLIAVAATWLLVAIRQTKRFLQYFQIEEYSNSRFLNWYFRNWRVLLGRTVKLMLGLAILGTIPLFVEKAFAASDVLSVVLAVGWILIGICVLFPSPRGKSTSKKPFVATARSVTTLAVAGLVEVVAALAYPLWRIMSSDHLSSDWLGVPTAVDVTLTGYLPVVCVLFAPVVLVSANILLSPIESLLRWRSVHVAQKRCASLGLKVIGVTGSYGKTTTKDMIADFLNTKYRVARTPQSYNTLLGISRIINDGDIDRSDVFVAELGAYQVGEIARLSKLLSPTIGVLTAVGPQHLERFGSLSNIARAKYELIERLPSTGLAVFNADDENCMRLARQTQHVRVALYGMCGLENGFDVCARDVTMTREGLTFRLVFPKTGESVTCRTRLLGHHNVYNILAAATVATSLGLSPGEIRDAISRLQPTQHRLELIAGTGGITVIDDTYNSNPQGAKNALDVLSLFTGGQRVLLTPGLVELGDLEAEENRKLGIAAAKACDVAILVGGKRVDPIATGLATASFNASGIVRVNTLQEATKVLQSIVHVGDTVLFLNDLPDTYEIVAG